MEKIKRNGYTEANTALIQEQSISKEEKLSEEITPVFNADETNDFDLEPESKPVLSTMKSNRKTISKRLAMTASVGGYVQQFDKLKMAIDLKVSARAIEFEFDLKNSNMIASDNPEKPETEQESNVRKLKLYESYLEPTEIKPDNNDKADINLKEFGIFTDDEDYEKELESETEPDAFDIDLTEEETADTGNITNNSSLYPDCKIKYTKTAGLHNIYIKNGILIIYLTGKFMKSENSLGYLTIDNIHEVLEKVCRLAGFEFNIERYIDNAWVYLCDICADLEVNNVDRYILALSSLFPLGSNKNRIMKYGRHGLKLKSKARTTGSSLTFYNKGQEIRQRVTRQFNRFEEEYKQRGITDPEQLLKNYPPNIENILRIEVQIYRLQDMRVLLDIPKSENRVVRLRDVLNSKAKPILKRFKAFECTEEKLKNKIEGYIEDEERPKTEIRTERQLERILASERLAELVKDNNHDFTRVKTHLITEYEIYSETFIKQLASTIKHQYWDFLLYRKPKAIKRVMDLLDKAHTYYGRGAGVNNG